MTVQFLCFYYNVAKFVENAITNTSSIQYDILGLHTFVTEPKLDCISLAERYFYDKQRYAQICSGEISCNILNCENIGVHHTLNTFVNKNSVLTGGNFIIKNTYIYETNGYNLTILETIEFKNEILKFLIMKTYTTSSNLRLFYKSDKREYIIISCTRGELNSLITSMAPRHGYTAEDMNILDYKNVTHKVTHYDFMKFLKKEYYTPDFTLSEDNFNILYIKLLLLEKLNEFNDFYFNLFEKKEYSFYSDV